MILKRSAARVDCNLLPKFAIQQPCNGRRMSVANHIAAVKNDNHLPKPGSQVSSEI